MESVTASESEIMFHAIQSEIHSVKTRLDAESQALVCLMKSFDHNNAAVLIQEDLVFSLERQLVTLQTKQTECEQLKEYQSLCEHEFVTDLIDIDPDRSTSIIYCKHCHLCK